MLQTNRYFSVALACHLPHTRGSLLLVSEIGNLFSYDRSNVIYNAVDWGAASQRVPLALHYNLFTEQTPIDIQLPKAVHVSRTTCECPHRATYVYRDMYLGGPRKLYVRTYNGEQPRRACKRWQCGLAHTLSADISQTYIH